MGFQAWLSVAVTLGVIVAMAATTISADVLFMAGIAVLLLFGVLDPSEAFVGFSNEGMLTVALLYVVVAGVRDTGGVSWLGRLIFGKPRSTTDAQVRLMAPVAFSSAWMNNTPLVAMLLPVVVDWAKKHGIASSKLLIPLSYASILGGSVTLIGTSTNLVVNGLLIKHDLPGFGMFTMSPVGLPCALIGIGAIILGSRWLLPDRNAAVSLGDDPRNYTIEMIVDPKGPLPGKSIEEAGLRHLMGAFLAEVDREGQLFPAVGPHFTLEAGDRLVFVGIVDAVLELQKIHGLLPAGDQVYKLDTPRPQRALVEAVVSESCPLIGRSIREGRFRNIYNAVVVAVARGGERIHQKIGDIVLQAGDVLLLETRPAFLHQQRNSRDFYLVSLVPGSAPIRHERAFISLMILLGMIVLASTNVLNILVAALLAGGLMLITRCTSAHAARRNIDWKVLVVIAASFGLGTALTKTGAATVISANLVHLTGSQPYMSLIVMYLVTMVFTEILSNNAAAALMFPIALSLSQQLGVSHMPFMIGITLAASYGFATPIGYQTNLMVYGPGGYKFHDFMRMGLMVDLLLALVALALIPFFFRF